MSSFLEMFWFWPLGLAHWLRHQPSPSPGERRKLLRDALRLRSVTARKDVTLWKRFMPPLPKLLGGLFAGLLMVH